MDQLIEDILKKMAEFREQLRNNTFNREILADLDNLTAYLNDDIGGRLKLAEDAWKEKLREMTVEPFARITELEKDKKRLEEHVLHKDGELKEMETRYTKHEEEWSQVDVQRKKDLETISEEMKQMEETIVSLMKENEKFKKLKEIHDIERDDFIDKLAALQRENEEKLSAVENEKEELNSIISGKNEDLNSLNDKIVELMRKIDIITTEALDREKRLVAGYTQREKDIVSIWNKNISGRDKKYQEIIEEYSVGMAQRLRSCVSVVSGVLQLASDSISKLEEKNRLKEGHSNLKKDIDGTLSEIEIVAKAIKAYLELAKAPVMTFSEANIFEKIKKVVNYYTDQIEKQKIEIKYNNDELMQTCIGDKETLRTIFNDIVQNAIEAMPNGGVLTFSASSAETPQGKYLKVSISDTGVGIDGRNVDKVFLPFFTTKENGEGMGLPRIKRNVLLNRGTVTIESKKDIGTTVNLTFIKGNN